MAKVAPLNVPVTVDTSGMDKGLKDAERKMRKGAERINKAGAATTGGGAAGRASRGIAMAGASTLGFGAAGGALGALGGVGFALGAVAAPFLAAARMADAMANASKGATAALDALNQGTSDTRTGFEGVNKELLKALSAREAADRAIAQGPTMAQAFLASEKAAAGAGPTATQSFAEFWGDIATRGAAGFGAMLGGSTVGVTNLSEQLAATSNPTQAANLQRIIASEARGERSEGYNTIYSNPIMFLAEGFARALYGVEVKTGL